MGNLENLLREGHKIVISGPYGTEVFRRLAEDIAQNQQRLKDVPLNESLGPDGSALLTEEGRSYIKRIAHDYSVSVPNNQPLAMMTPTFRIGYDLLHVAGDGRTFSSLLPMRGLELCEESVSICKEVISSTRSPNSVNLIAVSIGPSFDCYCGELTPPNVTKEYLPQTVAVVRFCDDVDYILYETVPSLRAAKGAARAFTLAHNELNMARNSCNTKGTTTIDYLGTKLDSLNRNGNNKHSHAHYDPARKLFIPVSPEKDYVISFCLEQDATLNGVSLNSAVEELYATIEWEKLIAPAGLGINCNSPQVTAEALGSLSPENRRKFVSIHPNASSERDPRKYCEMTHNQSIPSNVYVSLVSPIIKDFNLGVFGGCCGTDHHTMKNLVHAVNSP